jgi:hypothetical protein
MDPAPTNDEEGAAESVTSTSAAVGGDAAAIGLAPPETGLMAAADARRSVGSSGKSPRKLPVLPPSASPSPSPHPPPPPTPHPHKLALPQIGTGIPPHGSSQRPHRLAPPQPRSHPPRAHPDDVRLKPLLQRLKERAKRVDRLQVVMWVQVQVQRCWWG